MLLELLGGAILGGLLFGGSSTHHHCQVSQPPPSRRSPPPLPPCKPHYPSLLRYHRDNARGGRVLVWAIGCGDTETTFLSDRMLKVARHRWEAGSLSALSSMALYRWTKDCGGGDFKKPFSFPDERVV